MAEPKTPCVACGAMILPATASKTGGRCMPCANGTRASMDAGRRRAERERAFEASPVWSFWRRLVVTEFSRLTPAEQLYFAVNDLRGSVLRSGLSHYLTSHADHVAIAEEGLAVLHATTTLEALGAAKRVLRMAGSDDPAAELEVSKLEQPIVQDVDQLWNKLQHFGVANGFFPEPWLDDEQ